MSIWKPIKGLVNDYVEEMFDLRKGHTLKNKRDSIQKLRIFSQQK